MKQEEWGQISKSALLKCLLARSSAVMTGQGVEVTGAQPQKMVGTVSSTETITLAAWDSLTISM